MPAALLPPDALEARLSAIPGWSLNPEGTALRAEYRFPDFATALAFVNRVGTLAESANHHPDFTLGWGYVTLVLSTHDAGGVTEQDFALAGLISRDSDR